MKKRRTALALFLALLLLLTAAGCAKPAEEVPSSTPSAETPASAAPSDDAAQPETGNFRDDYKVGFSNLASGVWIIDLHSEFAGRYLKDLGFAFLGTSANFLSDQMVKDIQNAISAGVDGQIYYGAYPTLTESVSKLFEEAGVYWSDMDQLIPADMLDIVNANPYYCGAAGVDATAQGKALAEAAIEAGYRHSAIIAGAVGDVNHDNRINAWTQVFEENGGEVIAVTRCTDPSEAAAKADDLLAAYGSEVDCIYGINMDFIVGVLSAMDNYGFTSEDFTVFGSDVDDQGVTMIENGEMIGHSLANLPAAVLADALLLNALDGHPVLNEEGLPPYLNQINSFAVTADNAEDYKTYILEGDGVTTDIFKQLLYRYNPDVSYNDYVDFAQNTFTYEGILAMHGKG